MKLVFFALGVAVGSLFFSRKPKADLPKGFAEGGYVPRPAYSEPKFVVVDDQSNIFSILNSGQSDQALTKFIKRNRHNLDI